MAIIKISTADSTPAASTIFAFKFKALSRFRFAFLGAHWWPPLSQFINISDLISFNSEVPLKCFIRAVHCSLCALTSNLTLVTNNIRHFERIAGLKLESWSR